MSIDSLKLTMKIKEVDYVQNTFVDYNMEKLLQHKLRTIPQSALICKVCATDYTLELRNDAKPTVYIKPSSGGEPIYTEELAYLPEGIEELKSSLANILSYQVFKYQRTNQ